MGQMSRASPLPVRADMNTLSPENTQRTGLFSFSLMTTLTRSRLSIITLLSTSTEMGLFLGMAFL